MLDALTSWPTFLVALVVFGFAPGAVLRFICLAFRRDDPRRRELRAELYAVPRYARPFWVLEQLEIALFEGVGARLTDAVARWIKARRVAQVERIAAEAAEHAEAARVYAHAHRVTELLAERERDR